jgi:hypothetical protein
MKMKKNLIQFSAMLFVAGCAMQAPVVTTHYDPMGNRTDLLSENLLEASGPTRELVWLNASRMWSSSEQTFYYLEVEYMARNEVGLLEIPPGEMLTITADGQPMKFNGRGSMNLRKPYNKECVRERAVYQTNKKALQKIAAAKQVKVQLKGDKGLIEREFAKENFEKFRQFVALYAQ